MSDDRVALVLARECFSMAERDFGERLEKCDNYLRGVQSDPYAPDGMRDEMKNIMERSKQNWCALPVNAMCQTLAVDGYRRGRGESSDVGDRAAGDSLTDTEEWATWKRSDMDAKQSLVYRPAIAFGQGFTVVDRDYHGRPQIRVLSALHTAMIFEDVLCDDNALFALTITRRPVVEGGELVSLGRAYGWDRYFRYEFAFDDGELFRVVERVEHGGNGHNPVTRFYSQMDSEGRVQGIVEPLIPWQDSLNQTLFNMLAAQSEGAFRTIVGTGIITPSIKDNNGNPVMDEFGNERKAPVRINPSSPLITASPQARITALQPTDLSGFIEAAKMHVQHFSAITQVPPNFLLGQMANLSADALDAAEKSFRRRIGELKRLLGQSWARTFRVSRVVETGATEDDDSWEHGETVWRDFEDTAMSSRVDSLTKLATLGVPNKALWAMVPGVTGPQLDKWAQLAQDQEPFNTLDTDSAAWLMSGSSAPRESREFADEPRADAVLS